MIRTLDSSAAVTATAIVTGCATAAGVLIGSGIGMMIGINERSRALNKRTAFILVFTSSSSRGGRVSSSLPSAGPGPSSSWASC